MSTSSIFLGAVDVRSLPAAATQDVNIIQVSGEAPDFATQTTLAEIKAQTAQLTFDGDSALQVVEPAATEFVFFDAANVANPCAELTLASPAKLLTVYGNCSAECTITLQFYSAAKDAWFSSQYTYQVPSGGADFGFAVPACPKGVRLLLTPKTAGVGTITAAVSYL